MADKDSDFEYRVVAHAKDRPESATKPTENIKEAGETYKHARHNVDPGDTVAIQRRTVGKWEDLERETKE
jgi:hypothetical protein